MKTKFYGYSVAVGAILYLFCAWGMINVTNVAYAVFPEYFHANLAQITLGVTIYCVACFIFSFFAGEYQAKIGVKKSMMIGAVSMAIFCFIIASFRSIYAFYAAQLVVAWAGSTAMHACCTLAISNWFVEKRGTLISICMAAATFGIAAYQFVAGKVFVAVGVSKLYLYFGVFEFVALMLIALFLIRDEPAKYGQKPLGWNNTRESVHTDEVANAAVSNVSIYRNPVFWIMMIGFIFSMLCAAAVSAYTTTVLPSFGGYTLDSAAAVLSVMNLAGGVITMFVGTCVNKLGLKGTMILTGAGAFIANILMYVWIGAPSTILLILVGITFAIGMPFQSMSNLISGPVFGDQAYLANPKLMAFSNAGYSLFFPVLGAIATGAGFGPAYLANAVICLLTVIPFLIGLSIAEKKKRS